MLLNFSNSLVLISYILMNTATTILPILQDHHFLKGKGEKTFYHPLMQTEIMIVGEMLCLFAYLLFGDKEEKQGSKPQPPILICLIPMYMDLLATTLEFIAVNYISGSVFSITSSVVIVSSAVFTKVLLRTNFNSYQIAGCILTILGMIITGYGQLLDENPLSDKTDIALGMTLTFVAFVIEGLEIVVVQIILAKYEISPAKFVGVCGAAGTVIWTTLLIILSNVGCPFASQFCVEDSQGFLHIEHIPSFFGDLANDPFLIAILIIHVLLMGRYNIEINNVISIGSAMIFQIVTVFSNGFVWLVGIAITIVWGKNEQYEIESLNMMVILVKLSGFVFSTIGLLLYNKETNKEQDEAAEIDTN